ncbi:polyprenyl synthetase family protein [Capnocytophaga canimorsus]|uniref:polyprenyl synthetase family protein n=1 Tax=Capnocytophaga canimorsus TaxID=28188 RepID=UPI0037D6840E
MSIIESYREAFLKRLENFPEKQEPANLYAPMHYILQLGGKRIRPILTLMGADIFGTDYQKAMYAALAVEVFHNFSLVHDDIMDKASLRRGQQTIHEKWDLNTAILSGDAMLIIAYQLFENYEPTIFRELAQIFSKTALEVCEGQQHDMDFETRNDVKPQEYLLMIKYKTAVLVGAALQMGAIVAKTSEENKKRIYDFGVLLGMAFQLQDDYLDTFGDKDFGKRIGGDILENKKTMLVLKALENANAEQHQQIMQLYTSKNTDETHKIVLATRLFKDTQSDVFLREEIKKYTFEAFTILENLDIPQSKKELLKKFGTDLMNRKI